MTNFSITLSFPIPAGMEGANLAVMANELKLPVSCVGTAEKFGAPEFVDLIATLPELTIVLEHLGGTLDHPVVTTERRSSCCSP